MTTGLRPGRSGWWVRWGKRVFDLCVALAGGIILAPVMLFVALLVRVRLGSPILFRQRRPGVGARPFTLYKFRSMRELKDADGNLLSDSERLTAFGRRLRKWSLDEVPELWNVVRGDMSLVGPRPLLEHYLPLYNERQARRHEVRPGLTGWAQVQGRNRVSWEEQLEYDAWYVDHVSPALDLRILLLTAGRVLSGDDVSQRGHPTREEFRGQSS